jgi:hypothetical protein
MEPSLGECVKSLLARIPEILRNGLLIFVHLINDLLELVLSAGVFNLPQDLINILNAFLKVIDLNPR